MKMEGFQLQNFRNIRNLIKSSSTFTTKSDGWRNPESEDKEINGILIHLLAG